MLDKSTCPSCEDTDKPFYCSSTQSCLSSFQECAGAGEVCPPPQKFCSAAMQCLGPEEACPSCPTDTPYFCNADKKCKKAQFECKCKEGMTWCPSTYGCVLDSNAHECVQCQDPQKPFYCHYTNQCSDSLFTCQPSTGASSTFVVVIVITAIALGKVSRYSNQCTLCSLVFIYTTCLLNQP